MKAPPIPEGTNKYCGPYALALALGVTTDAAASSINRARGKRGARVGGVRPYEVTRVLRASGRAHSIKVPMGARRNAPYTFARWLREESAEYRNRVVIIETARHFVVVFNGMVSDNRTRAWIDPATAPHYARAHVLGWWSVAPLRARQARPALVAGPGVPPGPSGP